jgi:hypothetical protein
MELYHHALSCLHGVVLRQDGNVTMTLLKKVVYIVTQYGIAETGNPTSYWGPHWNVL